MFIFGLQSYLYLSYKTRTHPIPLMNSPDHNPSSTTQQPTTIPLGPVTGQPTSNPETNSNATPTVFAMPPPEYTAT